MLILILRGVEIVAIIFLLALVSIDRWNRRVTTSPVLRVLKVVAVVLVVWHVAIEGFLILLGMEARWTGP